MDSPEARSSRPEAPKERIHKSVRVFCFAPKRVEQLDGELSAGTPIDELSLVEVVLARKNDTRLVTALGGEIFPGEDLLHAAGRKVFEESLLTRESRWKLDKAMDAGTPIPYLRNDKRVKCEAFLTVMPVRSATVSLHEPRENNNQKSIYEITELVHVTPPELAALFSKGKISTSHGEELHMFGHLTQLPVSDVTLTHKGRQIQNREFSRVLDEICSYEFDIRNEMVQQINRIRHLHHKPKLSTLGECGHSEIVKAYILAKWALGMADNRIREVENKTKPTVATDLPTSALFLREFPPEELSDALMAAPTREVRRARNAVFHALQKSVGELYELMGVDIRSVNVGGTDWLKPMDLVAALRYIWPTVLQKSPETVTTTLSHLDQIFTSVVGAHLHKSDVVIRRALSLPSELPPYIAGELRGVKKNIFQEYFPANEVTSAAERPFVQMLYIFGLHPYKNISAFSENEAMKRIRGDILMQFAIQLSAIPAIEQQLAADNSLFEKVLADFMMFPPELDQLRLKRTPHIVYRRQTEGLIDGRRLELWHDKRMVKSILRLWLKSLQDPVSYDMFSHNFAIKDSNFSEEDKYNIPMRLDATAAFSDALLTFFREELAADGWEVTIVPGTHKIGVIDTARKIISVHSGKERKKIIRATDYRKRAGSIANTIVREKFVIACTKNGRMLPTEICVYPIERANADGSPLSGSGLIGFVEKLVDDMNGNYNGYRLIKTDDEDPTAPSVLELIRPPVWQRSAYDEIWPLQHKPKPKRKRKK